MREIAIQELAGAIGSREKAETYMNAMVSAAQPILTKDEVIKQLDSLIENAKSLMTDDPKDNEVWEKDLLALNEAKKAVEISAMAVIFQALANKLANRVKELTLGLTEVRNNLRSIDGPNPADDYINDALDITVKLLKEDE